MLIPQTEALHDHARGIDDRPLAEAAEILAQGQIAAAGSVRAAVCEIADGARALAHALRAGGTVHYVAAGSSGLMAAADAQELGGTFSIPPDQLRIHMAGGLPTGVEMPGATEDETTGLEQALAAIGPCDAMISVSASGSTLYTLRATELARAAGTKVIAISNNSAAPLLAIADHPILLATPARSPFGIDAHGRWHGAKDCAEHAFDPYGDRAGSCARRYDGEPACRQCQTARARLWDRGTHRRGRQRHRSCRAQLHRGRCKTCHSGSVRAIA